MKFPEKLFRYFTTKEQALIKEKVLPLLEDDLAIEKGIKTRINSAISLLQKFHIPLDKKDYKKLEQDLNAIPPDEGDKYYKDRIAEDLRRMIRDVKYKFFDSPSYWIKDKNSFTKELQVFNDLLKSHEEFAKKWVEERIKPVMDDLGLIRDIIDYLNNLSEEIKKDPASVNRQFSKGTGEKIKQTLTELTKEFKEDFIATISKNIDGVVDRYITWAGEQKKLDSRNRDRKAKWPHHIGKLVNNETLTRVANYDDIVKEVATATATELLDKFIYKNTQKIGTIVEKKGNLSGIKLVHIEKGGLVEGIVLFEFEDKSSFRVKSKMIYNQTMYGDMYVQYPTTFHDIKMKDGTQHTTKPESWMIDSFPA